MVKGVLAGLAIPSVRQELHANAPVAAAHPSHKDKAGHGRHSVPLPYPVGMATLQLSGTHLRLVPRSPAKPEKKRSSAASDVQDGEDQTVRVNVVVKVHVKGDVGEAPAQEYIAAVVPLKYTPPQAHSASSSEPARALNGAQRGGKGSAGAASSSTTPPAPNGSPRQGQHPRKGGAADAAVASKYITSTGHMPFDKRKLNAMRREQLQQQQDEQHHGARVIAEAGAAATTATKKTARGGQSGGTPAALQSLQAPPPPQWLSAAVGPEAFARLDVRVQMERVRVVVELLPMLERVKRQRPSDSPAHAKHAKAVDSLLDCSLEVSILGSVTLLA